MPDVLRQPSLGDARVLSAPDHRHDPAITAAVAAAEDRAYARGRDEGRAAALKDAEARYLELATRLADQLEQARNDLADLGKQQHDALIDTSISIAQALVGASVVDVVPRLVGRILESLAVIDDAPLTIRVSTEDQAAVTAALAGRHGLEVAGDAAFRSGEARITGPWVDADLTWAHTWDAVSEALRDAEGAA